VEVVPFKAANQNLDKSCLSHFLFDSRVGTDVEEDIEANKEELVLLPDEDVENFQLFLCAYSILLIIFPPHFDILAVEQVKTLNLIFKDIHDGDANFVLG